MEKSVPVRDYVDAVLGKTKPKMAAVVAALSKRPWNEDLKKLIWKIGESFVKVSGSPKDYYGKVYVNAKEELWLKNKLGAFTDEAIKASQKVGKAPRHIFGMRDAFR